MDFLMEDDLDLRVSDTGEYLSTETGDTTLITAFFSDIRVRGKRGYYLPILSSDLWIYDQARITNRTVSDMTESARAISAELVDIGLYDDIEAAATIDDNIITLTIKCYNDQRLVVERKFAI